MRARAWGTKWRLAVGLVTAIAPCLIQAQPLSSLAPEGASPWQPKPNWTFKDFAVATAHPLASEAGASMLRQGGSAIDAAIAAQLVLNIVEPQSSGLGGGGFLVYYGDQGIQVYDGREVAPQDISESLFLESSGPSAGQPMAFSQAMVGGRSVGVPGLLAMLHLAHSDHGRLPWATLFQPAITLAESGFAISPRLHRLIAQDPYLHRDPEARRLFYDAQGRPWPVGHRLRNPAFSLVLKAIAQQGPRYFYQGPLADAIATRVQSHAENPGVMQRHDLASYTAIRRSPLCFTWHPVAAQRYQVCGPPPPSSGTVTLGQILKLFSMRPDLHTEQDQDHVYLEASRLAYADRDLYIADPAFIAAPAGDWQTLLAPDYLHPRARLITDQSFGRAKPGQPGAAKSSSLGPMVTQHESGTSHISIFDGHGHALALTSSIESAFGARLMVQGMLLNNQLTDFSFSPTDPEGRPIANRPQPGKRPRSSMTPVLVTNLQTGKVELSTGSAGGALIIHYVGQALNGVFRERLSPQESLNQPYLASLNGPTLIEAGRMQSARLARLMSRGVEIRPITMTSGTQMILKKEGALLGAADPRREGWVVGQ